MEPVAGKHIENLRITPDIDRNLLTVKAELNSACPSDFVEVNVYDGNQLVATGKVSMQSRWRCRPGMPSCGVRIPPSSIR